MTKSTDKALKSFANRAAEMASLEDVNEAIRLLKLTGLFSPEANDLEGATLKQMPSNGAKSQDQTGFGIWSSQEKGGKKYFTRRMDLRHQWYLWANLGRIGPKGTKLRVVLIGESVARGYLYDPQFNPAMALQAFLDSALGKDSCEVLDLARTNLGHEICDLAKSVIQLDPDLVVIFAGNNWRPNLSLEESGPRIDAILREEGIAGLKKFSYEQWELTAKRHASDIASAYKTAQIPLLWVIPEFNLADWRDPISNAPHLPAGSNRKWLEYFEIAERELLEGNLDRAAEFAGKLTGLDQGTSPAGFHILAECSLRRSDLRTARQYLERARDSEIWFPGWTISPRMTMPTRNGILQVARSYGNHVVDAKEILEEFLEGGLPGRRLFLDYCHMSDEGISVLMAATASPILSALKGMDVPLRDLLKQRIAPSAKVRAEAAFLAALHNAHWWQRYDLVSHYCQKALQLSPHVADTMVEYLDIQSRRAPMLMCSSAEKIYEHGSSLINHYLLHFNGQQLDIILLSAIVDALKTVGVDMSSRLDQIRREEHSVSAEERDLLSYYYCSAALPDQEKKGVVRRRDEYLREAKYYKAYWKESRFAFLADSGKPFELEMTCRAPYAESDISDLELELNSDYLGRIAIERDWASWRIAVPADLVAGGINHLVLRWPMPNFPGPEGLHSVLGDLIDGRFPEFYCVFGEIHSLAAHAEVDATEIDIHEELEMVPVADAQLC